MQAAVAASAVTPDNLPASTLGCAVPAKLCAAGVLVLYSCQA